MNITPPAPDELEMSVFGPGYGECVVFHFGDKHWAVVDSCLGTTRQPVALEYLRSLGVDCATDVKLVVASHWHDDHSKGLTKILKACSSASFACSVALRSVEFRQVIDSVVGIDLLATDSGVDEIQGTWTELESRRQHPIWTVSQRMLISRARSATAPAAQVLAMTPTDADVTGAFSGLAREMTTSKAYLRALPSPGANDIAVALHLQFGEAVVILGSDVERRSWTSVVAAPLPTPASALKVPHHGGESAHLDKFWIDVMQPRPSSILTPFRRGNVELPTDADVTRLKALSHSLFQTSPTKAPKPIVRSPSVRRILDDVVGLKLHPLAGPMGHVRLRMSANSGAIEIEMRGAALKHS